jgi:hypothetical protein
VAWINGVRVIYRLVGPDGEGYGSAGQRWILEHNLQSGRYVDYDEEKDELVVLPLPDGCQIVEHAFPTVR